MDGAGLLGSNVRGSAISFLRIAIREIKQVKLGRTSIAGTVLVSAAITSLHTSVSYVMPKMKTKKSAAKRFQVRGSGSIKRGQAFKRHILTKKTTKNKRHLRGSAAVHETNIASVKAMMPFA